jgi:tRNA 2-thiouridine synthesizing protein A
MRSMALEGWPQTLGPSPFEARPSGERPRVTGMDMAEKTLNLRGLKCPLPALRARKALAGITADDVLVLECTDPLTAIDIPNITRQTGDHFEGSTRSEDVLVFRIRKR